MEVKWIIDPIYYVVIGIFFIISALMLYLGVKTYHNYLENRLKQVFYFGVGLISLGFASLFAGLEKTFLILYLPPYFVLSVNFIQVSFNSIGYLLINRFCLRVVIPKYEKKVFIFNLVLASIDLIIYMMFPPTILYSTYELTLHEIVTVVQLVFGIPIVLMIPILLFYYSYIMRMQSPPHSNRSFWLGMANIFIFFVYNLKIFLPKGYADLTRLLWIPAFLFWYICFISFIEADWPKKVRYLYIILADSGICIFDHPFITTEELMERQLIGGTLAGISGVVQEITRSKQKLQLLDQGDTKILLEYGTFIIGVLITEENFSILRKKLKKLVERFEVQFKELLQDFSGSLNEFEETIELINEIFSYKDLIDRTTFH
ncbi:MAG: hypothetical protein ACFFDN_49060 [Candidatus Hodarchaeota archaeon]